MADLCSNRPFCSNNLIISSECKKSRWSTYILHTLALNLKKILFKNIGLELCFMIVVSTFFPHQILVMLSPCLWEVYGWFGLLQQSSSCFCGMWSENRELWLRCPLIYFPHCRGHLHCWWTCEKTKKSQNWKKCTCIIIRFRH